MLQTLSQCAQHIRKIKQVAQSLLATLEQRRTERGELVERAAAAQAQLKNLIIDELLAGLPDEYSSDDIQLKAAAVFHYLQRPLAGPTQWLQ
jgi:type I restriction enzyme R subunit